MGGLFSKPEIPPPPPIPKVRMPTPVDKETLEAARRQREAARMRSGRSSTILTDNAGSSGQRLGS